MACAQHPSLELQTSSTMQHMLALLAHGYQQHTMPQQPAATVPAPMEAQAAASEGILR
jgi:hypothetical protein